MGIEVCVGDGFKGYLGYDIGNKDGCVWIFLGDEFY